MRAAVQIAAASLVAYAAWRFAQAQAQPADQGDAGDGIGDWVDYAGGLIVSKTVSAFGLWRAPEKYATLIAQAERASGLPETMLERLLYQESRYREDIITGRVRSSVGAMGIAQFMPATAAEMGIDPLNPAQAIPAAARYLRGLFNRFGNWSEALAAYNWGQGNVARKGLAAAPLETRNYFSQILADVNEASGTAYA